MIAAELDIVRYLMIHRLKMRIKNGDYPRGFKTGLIE
jgi:hypothetical protein